MSDTLSPNSTQRPTPAERSALRKLKIVGLLALCAVIVTAILQNTGAIQFNILIWQFRISLILLLLLVATLATGFGFAIGRLYPARRSG